jgi:WD40 repeat protein
LPAVSRLFLSHSSKNDDWAIALRDWLVRERWSAEADIFLDLDPDRGIVAGEKWRNALEEAATRCEAVLFLVSEAWLASKWCWDEFQLAKERNKKLFALLIENVPLQTLPNGLTAEWQVVPLLGEPSERFVAVHPHTQQQFPVHIAKSGLARLKRGLEKAGLRAETFELQPDPAGPFGWRAVYRGLEALEPQDAAVFFGRDADIVRGIDALRGLASRKSSRLLVILGASGAGKSSYLRGGLWPRLLRDDSQWVPMRAIRSGRGGAVEGNEGLLAALEDVHTRFALQTTRAALRESVATPEAFVRLLQNLRQAAARRAHLDQEPFPLPVLCLDQGEEMFAADAGAESASFLGLSRAAIDSGEALLLVTIRSDAYSLMQSAPAFADVDQVPLSLGPVPQGEIGRVIREPAEALRRKAGPKAPTFDPAVVEQLQQEIAGEPDALPILAFVLQRLMREHTGLAVIGLAELEQTGGVAAAIEREAEAALADAGYGRERATQREVLRRLFIPRLARIDRESKAPQRRVALQRDLPSELAPLARALTERRLLVVRAARESGRDTVDGATLEVAHEAMLRHWSTLADLLTEDRDALLLLDGVLTAATDWEKAEHTRKADFLAHRGSRLFDAQAIGTRGLDWEREIGHARGYLAACQARETAEREEREAALEREKWRLAEIAAAQADTARIQRRARWIIAAMIVLVAMGLGVVGWQFNVNQEQKEGLSRERLRAELEQQERHRAERANETARINLLSGLAAAERLQRRLDSGLRLAAHAAVLSLRGRQDPAVQAIARTELATAIGQLNWRTMLSGHQESVLSARFDPSGQTVLTASGDGTARIWRALSGEHLITFVGHSAGVISAAFNHDGKRVVTSSLDKTVRIWNAETGEMIQKLETQDTDIFGISFSSDGRRIIGAGKMTARIWDVMTGGLVREFLGREPVTHAVFSPDGSHVVTLEAFAARIWDAETGEEIREIRAPEGVMSFAVLSPDGKHLLTVQDSFARIWDIATGEQIRELDGRDFSAGLAAYSPDGTKIVTASDDAARIWEAETGDLITILRGHGAKLTSAAFSPDGSHIVTSSHDDTARIWDIVTSRKVGELRGHDQALRAVEFVRDGSRIITASLDGTARIWDAVAGKEIRRLQARSEVNFAAFSPDGKLVVTAEAKAARLWNAETGTEMLELLQGYSRAVRSASFSPDGRRVATAEDNSAYIWNTANGRKVLELQANNPVYSVAFSADGTRILTADGETARIWDAATGRQLSAFEVQSRFAIFDPEGSRIVTDASIWDASTGKEIVTLNRGRRARTASFSPDGTRIATASHDGATQIRDAITGREITLLRGHKWGVYAVAFSPDGSRLLTAGGDSSAGIWDVHFAAKSTQALVADVCTKYLLGSTRLTRDEMRLAGYRDDDNQIDVCAGRQ